MNDAKVRKKRTRNPERTRAKLLQAAADLLAAKGPEALSLKEVASRADVSRSATYIHFQDRDHLLREAKTWITSRLKDDVETYDEEASLYDRVLRSTRLVLEHPEISQALMVDALSQGELGREHPLVKSVIKRLSDLKSDGLLGEAVDEEILVYLHLGSIASTLMLSSQHAGEDPDELAERFAAGWSRILEQGMFGE